MKIQLVSAHSISLLSCQKQGGRNHKAFFSFVVFSRVLSKKPVTTAWLAEGEGSRVEGATVEIKQTDLEVETAGSHCGWLSE